MGKKHKKKHEKDKKNLDYMLSQEAIYEGMKRENQGEYTPRYNGRSSNEEFRSWREAVDESKSNYWGFTK